MMYKVIEAFADLQDGNHVYRHGDTYPRAGYNPTSERINELSCSSNMLNRPLIEAVAEPKAKAEAKAEVEAEVETKPEDVEPTKAEAEKTAVKTRRKTTK